jgi:transcriptional regulator with XRE-family HTH domain
MDRQQLADFLHKRRESLQPEDVGLTRGPRRRTAGLRREEVASLAGMSTDYYSRLEQQRGPQPSEQMVIAIARGLRLSLDERDHLFRLAGHNAPIRGWRSDHVTPALMRVLDRLDDTPALVLSDLGERLASTPAADALLGRLAETSEGGWMQRSTIYRWFTDPRSRAVYPEADHPWHTRVFTSDLRDAYSRQGSGSLAAEMVTALLAVSPQFAELWEEHEVGLHRDGLKRIQNAEVGVVEVYCQTLFDRDRSQGLLVFTATPGSESAEKLKLLAVLGQQQFTG